MAKMVYDERFGEITFAQRAAYRKFNVSQSDHDSLAQQYGKQIEAALWVEIDAQQRRSRWAA